MKLETGRTPRLGDREKLFWVAESILSPPVVDDMRPILQLPDERTIREWKYVLEEKLNIKDSWSPN